jgi:hypothetical protein
MAKKKKVAPKKAATKKAAPKKAATKKAPKAPAAKFIVVRDSCQNVLSRQLQDAKSATSDARQQALDYAEAHTLYRVVAATRFNVPDIVIVEDLTDGKASA